MENESLYIDHNEIIFIDCIILEYIPQYVCLKYLPYSTKIFLPIYMTAGYRAFAKQAEVFESQPRQTYR